MTNLLTLPVANAKLPAVYERAKEALLKCSTLDECAEWKNKAEAIASYARQSEDESLFQMATRIKARAIRRCGQLLKEIEAAPNQHVKPRASGGAPTSRNSAAKAAGLSRDQKHQALRVASLDDAEFESAIERKKPATVTELAKRGTNTKPPSVAHLEGRDPQDFCKSTQAQAALRHFVLTASEISAVVTVRGAVPAEFARMASHMRAAGAWLMDLAAELEKARADHDVAKETCAK